VRRRILLVTPFAPARDGVHGSALAVHGVCSALAEAHELMIVHLDAEAAVDPALAGRCAAVESLAVASAGSIRRRLLALAALAQGRPQWAGELGIGRIRRRVAQLGESFAPHVVQVEHTILASALAAARAEALRVVTIYDPAGSWHDFAGFHQQGPRLAHRLDALAAARQERRALALADGAIVFTAQDLRTVTSGRRPPRARLACIPLGWNVPATALDPVGSGPPTVLFVGNFRHPPNRDAASRLVESIFPRVVAVCPQARLEIVGPDPPAALLIHAGQGVHITGAVPSLTPHLDRAAVVTAPLRLGGGMRIKVLEALAAGKAMVASPLAVAGLEVTTGQELLIADDDAATAAAVAALLSDPGRRRALGEAARAWAVAQLSWSRTAEGYERLYTRLESPRA